MDQNNTITDWHGIDRVVDQIGGIGRSFSERVHKVGLWVMVLLLAGFVTGVWGSRVYYERKVSETVQLKRFLFKNMIYEVKQIEINELTAHHR